jgi:hypothetical protein
MEINDLRDFDRIALRPKEAPARYAAGTGKSSQTPFATKERKEHKDKGFFLCALPVRQSLPAWQAADVALLWPFISGIFQFTRPPKIFKEQAPERLTYSILPRLDGTASTKIQSFFMRPPFSAAPGRCPRKSSKFPARRAAKEVTQPRISRMTWMEMAMEAASSRLCCYGRFDGMAPVGVVA